MRLSKKCAHFGAGPSAWKKRYTISLTSNILVTHFPMITAEILEWLYHQKYYKKKIQSHANEG